MNIQVKSFVKTLLWVTGPVLFACGAYGVKSGVFSREWHVLTLSGPTAHFPAVIDLGEQEIGLPVHREFVLSNRGGGTLVVDNIRTNCACAGLECKINGQFQQIESLSLNAGEHAELAIRMVVQGSRGGSMHSLLAFHTNDTTQPLGQIDIVVRKINGGMFFVPSIVSFNDVAINKDARQVIEVYDEAAYPRTIDKLISNPAEKILASFRPLQEGTLAGNDPNERRLIGRIEVSARTGELGSLDGEVEVHLRGDSRPPDLLLVRGRVVGPVEATPESIVLPRHSGAGKLYYADVLCWSTGHKSLTIVPEDIPGDLSVELLPKDEHLDMQRIRVGWNPSKRDPKTLEGIHKVHLRARVDGVESLLILPVFLISQPEGRR